jgi:hypothetical protein
MTATSFVKSLTAFLNTNCTFAWLPTSSGTKAWRLWRNRNYRKRSQYLQSIILLLSWSSIISATLSQSNCVLLVLNLFLTYVLWYVVPIFQYLPECLNIQDKVAIISLSPFHWLVLSHIQPNARSSGRATSDRFVYATVTACQTFCPFPLSCYTKSDRSAQEIDWYGVYVI